MEREINPSKDAENCRQPVHYFLEKHTEIGELAKLEQIQNSPSFPKYDLRKGWRWLLGGWGWYWN